MRLSVFARGGFGRVAVGYFFVADTQLDKDVCNMNEDSLGPDGKTSTLSSSGLRGR